MTAKRHIKYRYLKTKMALSQTIQSILDINRKRRFFGEDVHAKKELDEELKVLNAVAENHARALRSYEHQLSTIETPLPGVEPAVVPSMVHASK
ncbi:hypothetical protein [Lewinella sp. 4G2]|uniref:hypothetical protein n=1 Tax=Lewinella sp. 4G2 TaxID=1803372 RepID=UPI0007B4640C|nr:hypothetical protein [Lewinella sp. 4G2]OAV42639.1 hypothetical protein A3850_015445 [Lewinella sp. 4G2]